MTIKRLPRALLITLSIVALSACNQSESGQSVAPRSRPTWTPNWITVKYRSDPVDIGAPYFELLKILDSSLVRAAWFDHENYYLIINLNGTNYHYCSVPKDVWLQMKEIDSLGAYYLASIKGNFDCRYNYLPTYG